MHRDEQIGDKLHAAAIAESTEIMADPREAGEDVTATRIGRLVAAAIEREVAGDGLRAGAGERAIEHDDTGGGEPVARPLLRLDRECADLGDDEPWPLLRGKSFGRFVERRDARQTGQHEIGAVGRLCRRAAQSCPRSGGCDRSALIDIEAADPETGRDQVARDRAAHDAEPDDRNAFDRLGHLPPQSCRIGSPRMYLPRQNRRVGLSV